jgi:hypothetical protein
MTGGAILGGLVILGLLLRSGGKASAAPAKGDPLWTRANLIEWSEGVAEEKEIPAWLALATMELASGIRALPAQGSGPGRIFYPMGITAAQGAAATGLPVGSPELEAALSDPGGNVIQGEERLLNLWTSYGPDHERVRIAWFDEAAGRKGSPYPATIHFGRERDATLRDWDQAIGQFGGPSRGLV